MIYEGSLEPIPVSEIVAYQWWSDPARFSHRAEGNAINGSQGSETTSGF